MTRFQVTHLPTLFVIKAKQRSTVTRYQGPMEYKHIEYYISTFLPLPKIPTGPAAAAQQVPLFFLISHVW